MSGRLLDVCIECGCWLLVKLWFGAVLVAWLLFPGYLLVPALSSWGFDWPAEVLGLPVLGISVMFWKGVRAWPPGRRLTEAALRLAVSRQ
jgi:hypothetical protein